MVEVTDGALRMLGAISKSNASMSLFVDRVLGIVWASEPARHFLGLAAHEGDPTLASFVHNDDHEALYRTLGEAVDEADRGRIGASADRRVEIRMRHRTGRYVVLQASVENHLGTAGVDGISVFLRRVPDRLHLDRAIELLAQGEEFDGALRAIASYLGEELGAVATSITTRIMGRNVLVGTETITDDHPLVSWNGGWGPLGPSKLDEPNMTSTSELPADVAIAAVAFGAGSVVSFPVKDTRDALSGAIVAWVPFGPLELNLPEGAGRFAARLARLAILQERRRLSLLHQASTDPLTSLANRSGLDRVLENVTAADLPLGLIYCDLDGFKAVNDRWGHAAGDRLLVYVAQCLKEATRADDVGVRMGGDEFVVVCPRVGTPTQAQVIVDRLRARIEQPLSLGEATVVPDVSIGFAVATTLDELDQIVHTADVALYADKRARRMGLSADESAEPRKG